MTIKELRKLILNLPDSARFCECDALGDPTHVYKNQFVVYAGTLVFIPFDMQDFPGVKDLIQETKKSEVQN